MYSAKSFFKSTLWLGGGVVLSRLKYIFLATVVSHIGSLNLAIFYLTIHFIYEFANFSSRLVSASYNRFLRDKQYVSNKHRLNAAISSCLQTSLLLGVLLFILFVILAYPLAWLVKEPLLVSSFQTFALAIPFIVINNQVIQVFSLLNKYKELVIFQNFIETVLMLLSAYISVILTRQNIINVLAWQVIALAGSSIFALIMLFKVFKSFKLTKGFLPVSLNLSSIVFTNNIFLTLLNYADLFIIGFYLGPKMLGDYIALLVVPHFTYGLIISTFAMYIHVGNIYWEKGIKFFNFTKKVIRYGVVIVAFLTVLIVLYPLPVVHDIFLLNIRVKKELVEIFALVFFLKTLSWFGSQVLIIAKCSNLNRNLNGLLLLISLPAYIYSVPKFGFLGLGVAMLSVAILELIIKAVLVMQKTNINIFNKKNTISLLTALFVIVTEKYIINLNFNLFLVFFPIFYFGLLFVFKVLEKQDILFIRKYYFEK